MFKNKITMKTFEITKEQIRELAGSSFTCEQYLKELFPEAFEQETITLQEAEKELGKKITSTLSTNHIDINELFEKDDRGFYIWFLKQKAKL